MCSWNPGGKRRRKEREPQKVSRYARFRQLGMLSPNSLLGEFTGEQTHLKGQEDAQLSRHCSQNFELNSLRGRTSVGVRHGGNASTGSRQDRERLITALSARPPVFCNKLLHWQPCSRHECKLATAT